MENQTKIVRMIFVIHSDSYSAGVCIIAHGRASGTGTEGVHAAEEEPEQLNYLPDKFIIK